MSQSAAPNKIAVVTGANAGLGYQITLQLARRGYEVVMACRSAERAVKAQRALLAEFPKAKVTVMVLDASEPASIENFAAEFGARFGKLDLLVNNAGIAVAPLGRNSAGHELQLATNHLGAFALAGRLLPLMSAQSRIVNVGSLAHRRGNLDLEDLNWDRLPYDEWQAYSRSKLAVLNFTLELERRLRASGSKVKALAAHPGFAATEISRNSPALQPKHALDRWFQKQMAKVIPTAAKAAESIVHAATSPEARGGEYYGPTGFFEIGYGKIGQATLHPSARDTALAARLWSLSESLSGVRYLPAR